MDSSQRALQTNGKFFFKFVLELMAEKKTNRGVNIDQSAMFYISMDSPRQALLTNENFFKFVFRIIGRKPKKYSND